MESIATRAKYSRGAIYWHFKSRRDIYLAVLERGNLSLQGYLDEAMKAPSHVLISLRECLRKCLQEIQTNNHVRNVLEVIICRCDFSKESVVFKELQQKEITRLLSLLNKIMQRASYFGEIRADMSSEKCSTLICLVLVGAIKLNLMQQGTELERDTMAALDTMLGLIGKG